jgi:hypothetical protein
VRGGLELRHGAAAFRRVALLLCAKPFYVVVRGTNKLIALGNVAKRTVTLMDEFFETVVVFFGTNLTMMFALTGRSPLRRRGLAT